MKAVILLISIISWQNMLNEAKQHYMNYENDSCAVKVEKVRNYCLSHHNEEGVLQLSADVENVLGALAQVDGHRDSAAIHYRNAYGYVMRTEDRSNAPTYCINLADILRQTGNAPEAAQWLRRALSLSDSLKTKNLECAINTQLGQVYSDLRHTSMAETYFEAAEACCEKGSFDEYFLANARGNACFYNEEYSEAILYFIRAREAAKKTENEFNVRVTELNMGECYLSLHQLDSASKYISASYDFWSQEKYSDESILAAIRGMEAGLALEKGDIKETEKWLSYGCGGSGTSPIYKNAFNRHMMEISVLKGDWHKAYDYCQKVRAYSDSLSRSALESNFAEAEMRYSRDTTVLHQQLRISAQEARISRMGILILVSILLLIVLAEVIVRIQGVRKKEQQLTQEIINELKLENLKYCNANNKITVEDPKGDRYVQICEMVLFTYQADKRRWHVLLKDGQTASMQRDYHTEQILALSPSMVKMKPDSIVNMDYVQSVGIKDQKCILVEPFSNIQLYFSRRSAANVKKSKQHDRVLTN